MPANNTNTRNVIYVGDDPEERKYINRWDSTVFEYFFEGDDPYKEDEAECKFLKPSCGIGYCIYRNVKDVYVKVPITPYDGDTFAIMDITSINDAYVNKTYWKDRKLIKETPLSDDIEISLNTAVIYIDNTYDFPCNTKVIYNGVTYKAGDIFQLDNTCEFVHQFIYDKGINAWVVVKIDKECEVDVDVEIRYWDLWLPLYYECYVYYAYDYDIDDFEYSSSNKKIDKTHGYLPYYWKDVKNIIDENVYVDYNDDYKLKIDVKNDHIHVDDPWHSHDYDNDYDYDDDDDDNMSIKLVDTEYHKVSKGGRFRFSFLPLFISAGDGPEYASEYSFEQQYIPMVSGQPSIPFFSDWSMYCTAYNVVDGQVVDNKDIFPNIFNYVDSGTGGDNESYDFVLYSAWAAIETLPWNSKGNIGTAENDGIESVLSDLGQYRFTPITSRSLTYQYRSNIELKNYDNLNLSIFDLAVLKGEKKADVGADVFSNIMTNYYGEKWQEILKIPGMIYLNWGNYTYEENFEILKHICNSLKTRVYYDYIYRCLPWMKGHGDSGKDHYDLSALSPLKGNNVLYSRNEYIRHLNQPILVNIDGVDAWFKIPFTFHWKNSPNTNKIYGDILESPEGIVSTHTWTNTGPIYRLILDRLQFLEMWGEIAGKEKIIPSPTDTQQYIFYDSPEDAFYLGLGPWASTKHTFEKLYGDDRDFGFYFRTTELREPEIKKSRYFLQDVYEEKTVPIKYRVNTVVKRYIKDGGLPTERIYLENTKATTLNNPKIIKKLKTFNSDEEISDNFFFQKWHIDIPYRFINVDSTIYTRKYVLRKTINPATNDYEYYKDFRLIDRLPDSPYKAIFVELFNRLNRNTNTYANSYIFSAEFHRDRDDVFMVFDTKNDMSFFRRWRMDLLDTNEDRYYGLSKPQKEHIKPDQYLYDYDPTKYMTDVWGGNDIFFDMHFHDTDDANGVLHYIRKGVDHLNIADNSSVSTGKFTSDGKPVWEWFSDVYYETFGFYSNNNMFKDECEKMATEYGFNVNDFLNWASNTLANNRLAIVSFKDDKRKFRHLYSYTMSGSRAVATTKKTDAYEMSTSGKFSFDNFFGYGAGRKGTQIFNINPVTFQLKAEYDAQGDNAPRYFPYERETMVDIINRGITDVKTFNELWMKVHKTEDWGSSGTDFTNLFHRPDDLGSSTLNYNVLFKPEWALSFQGLFPEFELSIGVYTSLIKLSCNTPDFFLWMHVHYVAIGTYRIPVKVEFSEFQQPSIQLVMNESVVKSKDLNFNEKYTNSYRKNWHLLEPEVYRTYQFHQNWWNYNDDAILREEFQTYINQYSNDIVKWFIANVPIRLQPATIDDDEIYSAVFTQPLPTSNERINHIVQLFTSLEGHGFGTTPIPIYTLYPPDIRYYIMYERARYNDGQWNYYNYETSQDSIFERKWTPVDETKYPPSEKLLSFNVNFPDYKYIEYKKNILDKHLPRARYKNSLDWIFIKRYGRKHYFRTLVVGSKYPYEDFAIPSSEHIIYQFYLQYGVYQNGQLSAGKYPITKDDLRKYYYQNTSDPNPILNDFEPITYFVNSDVWILINKNYYSRFRNFILKTHDMKRLSSDSVYDIPINVGLYSTTERYVNSKNQLVITLTKRLSFKALASALYKRCAEGEKELSPENNLYEMYASGAYDRLLPNTTDYAFGDYFEWSGPNEEDAGKIEYVITCPSMQSKQAFYTIDIIFYLNALYRYDNQRRFAVEVKRKRAYYHKDDVAKAIDENTLCREEFAASNEDMLEHSDTWITQVIDNADLHATENLRMYEDMPDRRYRSFGYRITWRSTNMKYENKESSFNTISDDIEGRGITIDIASCLRNSNEVFGDGYKDKDTELIRLKKWMERDGSNQNELDRRVTKIEIIDMSVYNKLRKAPYGYSVKDAIDGSTCMIIPVSGKYTVQQSISWNDNDYGFGTLTVKLDCNNPWFPLQYFWKQDKPTRAKYYIFCHYGSTRYPQIPSPSDVSYYTTLDTDVFRKMKTSDTSKTHVDDLILAKQLKTDSINNVFLSEPFSMEYSKMHKGGIVLLYENIGAMKWTLDKISTNIYPNLCSIFDARWAEHRRIIDNLDYELKHGVNLSDFDREWLNDELKKEVASLSTTQEEFYSKNCYLIVDIQVPSSYTHGQINPSYIPDKGAVTISFKAENLHESNTYEKVLYSTKNIEWNIIYKGQQYDLKTVPRLIQCGMITSTHQDTDEILYTAFPYEYQYGTVTFRNTDEERKKNFINFIENNIELCDVDQERIPHSIICTRTAETDKFMDLKFENDTFSHTYLQTRRPVKPKDDALSYRYWYNDIHPNDFNSIVKLTSMPYYINDGVRINLYDLEDNNDSNPTDYRDFISGSDVDVNGTFQSDSKHEPYRLGGGDDFWYKFSLSNYNTRIWKERGNTGDVKDAFLGNDYIDGGEGNDVLSTAIGTGSKDTLVGGKGNDILIGHKSDKTSSRVYVINKGDGHDIIYNAGTNDIIQFGPGIKESDVQVTTNEYQGERVLKIGENQSITLSNCDFPITLKFTADGIYTKKLHNENDIISTYHETPDCFDVYIDNFKISRRYNIFNQGYKIVNDMYEDTVDMQFNVHDTIQQTISPVALILEFNKMIGQIGGPAVHYYQCASRYVDSCGPIMGKETAYAKYAERTLDFANRVYNGDGTWTFPIIKKRAIRPQDWDPYYHETARELCARLRPHNRSGYLNENNDGEKKALNSVLNTIIEDSVKMNGDYDIYSKYQYRYENQFEKHINNREKTDTKITDELIFEDRIQPEYTILNTDGLYPSGTIVFYNDYELDSPENISKMKFLRPTSVTGRIKCNIHIADAANRYAQYAIKRQNISFYLDNNDLRRILGWKDTKGTGGPYYTMKYDIDFRFYKIWDLHLKSYLDTNFSTHSNIFNKILYSTKAFYTRTNISYNYIGFNKKLNTILNDEMKDLYNSNKYNHCRTEWNSFLRAIQLLDERTLMIEAIMDDPSPHPQGLGWEYKVYDHVDQNIIPLFTALKDLCEYLAIYGPTGEMIETDQSQDERMPRWLDVALEKNAITEFEHAYMYKAMTQTFWPYRFFYYDISVEPISYEYGEGATSTYISESAAKSMLDDRYEAACKNDIIRNKLYLDASSHNDDWRWRTDVDAIPLNNPGDEEHKLVLKIKENIDDDNDDVYRTYLMQNSYNEWHFSTHCDLFETLRGRKYYGSFGTKEWFDEESPITPPDLRRRETEIHGDRYYEMEDSSKSSIEISPEKWYDTKYFMYWENNGVKTGYDFWFKEPWFISNIKSGYEVVAEEDEYANPISYKTINYTLPDGITPISEDGITVKEVSDPGTNDGALMYMADKKTKVTDSFNVKGDRTIVNVIRIRTVDKYLLNGGNMPEPM